MKKAKEDTPQVSPYLVSSRKRLFDLLLSMVGLILLLPMMLLVGGMIWVSSGWPVVFVQRRVGKAGKEFSMYKFRTMYKGAERDQEKYMAKNEADGPVFKIHNDPRFVGIGKWLANCGLDELPQLINVLKGEMSLVGPRPLPIWEEAKIPVRERTRRREVRPGLTSSWVIEGAHEMSFVAWMALDAVYLAKALMQTDVVILFRTIGILFSLLWRRLWREGE